MSVSDQPGAVAELDIRPPRRIAVGRGSAFAIGGYCYLPGEATRDLRVTVEDSIQPVEHFRLPRRDVYERLAEGDPGRAQAFRSGFVAIADVPAIDRPQSLEIGLVLSLAGGRELSVPLGAIEAEPAVAAPAEASSAAFPGEPGPAVAICMTTYNPPAELLRAQLASLREQTHRNWVCLISDDASEAPAFEALRAEIEGDPRFVVSRSERRLGFYRNFERALAMAPASAEFVTLCDQDDRWHPHKVERLLGVIGDARLIYSDARLVDTSGELLSPSYWTTRRNNHTNFASLLLANSVTGAASLFRRDLLEDALPFPPVLANPFHDHWLAMVAMALGEIAYIDAPLYDYTQHGSAVIGHSVANRRPRAVHRQLLKRLRNPGDGSQVAYYYAWQQQLLQARVLRIRCRERMTAPKRRTLNRLIGADRRLGGLGWLMGRRIRRLWGRNETLDRELFYAYALGRRRAVSVLNAGRKRPGRWLPRDASIPPPGSGRDGGS